VLRPLGEQSVVIAGASSGIGSVVSRVRHRRGT
jgi:short-subunit dehydrogenase